MTLVKFSDARTPILVGLRKSLGGSESCVSCRVAWLLGGLDGGLVFVTLQMPHRWDGRYASCFIKLDRIYLITETP